LSGRSKSLTETFGAWTLFGGFVIGHRSPDDEKVLSECKKTTFFPVGRPNRGSNETVEFGLTEKRCFLLDKPAGELGARNRDRSS